MQKRRHHYVWQYYLSAWVEGGTLACRMGQKVFRTATANVAVQKDFYRIGDMTPRDIELLLGLIAKSPRQSQRHHLNLLRSYAIPGAVEAAYRRQNTQNLELETALAEARTTMDEDWHTAIEHKAIPLLQALRSGDLQPFRKPEPFGDFMHFLCTQMFRTKRLLVRATARMALTPHSLSPTAWSVLRHIISVNVAGLYVLHRADTRLTLLRAPDHSQFITGDQPVLNTYGQGNPDGPPPEKMQLYYPISPTLALLVSWSIYDNPGEGRTLDSREIAQFNSLIVRSAEEQIYAVDEGALAHNSDYESTDA